MEPDPRPSRALVQPDRVRVVVGRDQPESFPTDVARVIDNRVEQHRAGTDAAVRRDEHDELGVAFDLVPERATDGATVELHDESVKVMRVVVDLTA
jgi:hypothetical protein